MKIKSKEIYIGSPSVFRNSRFFVMNKILLLFILLIFVINPLYAEDIKIIKSTPKELIFEYSPIYLSENHFRDERDKILPLFEDASPPDFKNIGKYDYRFKLVPIALPNFKGNQVNLIETEYYDIHGVSLKTVPMMTKENGILVPYNETTFDDEFIQAPEIVSLGNIGIARNVILGEIRIYPYQMISSNTVRIYTRIRVNVIYGIISSELISYGDDVALDGILNRELAKDWKILSNKTLKKITNSKLSNGNWYKIKINEEGIYKLDFNYLKSKGIDLSGVDPKTIKIYGNGGKQLPENPELDRPNDLIENAIYVAGENDGKFDSEDYILFYSPATKGIEFDTISNTLKHYFHHYSDFNYVFLTYGGELGKRMLPKEQTSGNPDSIITTTTGLVFQRDIKKNLTGSGREWFGDEFNYITKSRVYTNILPGLVSNQTITYRIRLAARSSSITSFTIEESGQSLGNINVNGVNLADGIGYYALRNTGIFTRSSNLSSERSVLKITYNISDAVSSGYLEYYEILYPRYLKAFNDKITFYSPNKNGTFEYVISEFSNSDILVFDVKDFANVKIVSGQISGMQFTFRAKEVKNSPSKYFAVGRNGYLIPNEIIKIPNQNLHGIIEGGDFIIITPKEFLSEANRLKSFKESRKVEPLKTIVAEIDQIYNEFSGGVLDVSAIRDFIRYAYLNWQIQPKYVLLFGDGTYDYRNVEGYGKNFIPPYETNESLYQIYSYPTDDFYAQIIGNDNNVDIALGRLTIQTTDDAKNVVDKIISYETNKVFGLWRNLITLVADDGKTTKGDDGSLHTGQSENLSKQKIPSAFDQKKIYLIQYPTYETALGRRKPDVNKAIIDAFNEGTLIMNFIGHGNPEVWTHEYVFEKSVTIPQLKNRNKLCFLSAATCDFGDYDKPSSQSSMEQLVLKSDGGIIAGFTAARAVWSDQNAAINESLFTNLLGYRNNHSAQPSIGLAYFNTKKFRTLDNDKKYHLYGDPTIYLLAPQGLAKIDSINGISPSVIVELKSLNQVSILGTVRDEDGNINSNYNGEAILTVFDSKRYQEVPEWFWTGPNSGIELTGGIIYRGRVSIRNGEFKTKFIVPKDVSYEGNLGKVTAYFYDGNNDGFGFTQNIKIGASDTVDITDKNGPNIQIFFDNDLSIGANLVSSSPLLIVKLEDESGINTTGVGIGHNIEAIINEEIDKAIFLNDYFQGELDQGNQKGVIQYRLSNLPHGKNKVKITAWDVFNNPNSVEKEFYVVGENQLVIRDVYNFPNPTSSTTVFTFQHNYDQPIDVTIKIYTISGRMIHQIKRTNVLEKFVKISWDGRDSDGDLLGNGLYLYKIVINSLDNEKRSEALGKLAIIR